MNQSRQAVSVGSDAELSPARIAHAALSTAQAAARLAAEGSNELPSSGPRSLFAIAFSVVREPMFLLLMSCGALYLVMGSTSDAVRLIGFVVVFIIAVHVPIIGLSLLPALLCMALFEGLKRLRPLA